ncbi:MAG: ABC-F family ATP-binding cassette domain-containing protein [Lachnospiraceae bacterium]|nr:ABC-F family ATP-binding cassette domain-containing protein [Lachnospiraceae bacterium]
MNLLSLEQADKVYGEKTLLRHVDFFLNEGDKVGIIGINGTGKSTLLRILAGTEEPDDGKRTVANHAVMRMLEQNPAMPAEMPVLEYVLSQEKEEERWLLESDAKTLLTTFDLNDYTKPCGQLSGGQKKRAALARVLLKPADILILDEPTNHLDTAMSDWLEDFLKKYRGALIMVTHDRYFLDQVTNRIVEIDHAALYSYEENYSGYLEKKAQREQSEDASAAKRRNILRTELEWLHRGARARSTKQKAHIQRIEAMQQQKDPIHDRQVELSSISTRLGRTTLELEGICKGYDGKEYIRDFSYIFLKGDRIGIIGPNGCGKTTLMKILSGSMEPDAGSRNAGITLKLGYYTQEIASDASAGLAYMDPQKRVIDYIRDTAEYVQTTEGLVSASVMLDRFLFPPSAQYQLIRNLSGGEKKRLYLLRVLMEAPNLLLLDEPANDLDIQTMTVLEDYLDRFDGIVVTVSHDRYFLDRCVKRIFAFEPDHRLRQFEGGYSDYAAVKRQEEELLKEQEAPKKETAVRNDKGKPVREKKLRFTFQEQKDYETIEEVIRKLEEEIAGLDREIEKAATDFGKLRGLMEEKEKKEALLDEKMDRWMYLMDLAEKIEAQK